MKSTLDEIYEALLAFEAATRPHAHFLWTADERERAQESSANCN